VTSSFRLHALFENSDWQQTLTWEPLFPCVQMHRLYDSGSGGARAALLRFQPGGTVPLHEHVGFEHIIVLEGEQTDDHGTAAKGDVIINAPGTRHRVLSETGCIVLAIYEKPVRFIHSS
jgi:anti-sigma factor ChrR (cupin superfamily)